MLVLLLLNSLVLLLVINSVDTPVQIAVEFISICRNVDDKFKYVWYKRDTSSHLHGKYARKHVTSHRGHDAQCLDGRTVSDRTEARYVF